jgi:hypothetical protein
MSDSDRTDASERAVDNSAKDAEDSAFDPRTATYSCEVCGRDLSFREYVAVGPETPAAKHLALELNLAPTSDSDSDTEDTDASSRRTHFVVCQECFEQAAADIAGNGMSDYRLGRRAAYPLTEAGELDFQTMADDLGIAEVAPYSKVFITDGTGHVRRIVSCDTDRGLVRLRDEYNGQEYDVELPDLWSDWRYDDLQFRKRAFLDYDDFVIDDERRPAFEILLNAAKAHAAAQDGGDEALDEAIRLFTNPHELPWNIR